MIGAIAGDVLGSVYEAASIKTKRFRLFDARSRPTDDSILTLGVARAILDAGDNPGDADFAQHLRRVGRKYPHAGYGGHFRRWLQDDTMGPYQSWGNGSAMRSSAVGWAAESVDEVLRVAERTALPTHDHPEGIKGAQAVALAVFLARRGTSREEIRAELTRRFGYALDRTVDGIRPGYRFEISCQRSVPESIIAFLDSVDFVDAIRNAISLGGDADTQACIAGAIAEASYGGVPDSVLHWVIPRLDGTQLRIARDFSKRYMAATAVAEKIDRIAGFRLLSAEARQPSHDEPRYRILLHRRSQVRLADYAARLESGDSKPGDRLARELEVATRTSDDKESQRADRKPLSTELLLSALLNSKRPRIFAESEVSGDGRDWTAEELSILGDIGIAVPVTIYDNGRHHAPELHDPPISGTLLFIPGALLRARSGAVPADWKEVVKSGAVNLGHYTALYERRLLPLLKYAANRSRAAGRQAFVTVPGLGCGQFAGHFRGQMGSFLREALRVILTRHAAELEGLRAVWFDPYSECENERHEIGRISYLVRPLKRNRPDRPQLCHPTAYQEPGDDYSSCDLYSMVAWDHVSWPGNDFYAGARATDDGVKAAATDSMYALTGFLGTYDRTSYRYLPPADLGTWEQVVASNGLRIDSLNNVVVVGGMEERDDTD